MGAKPVSGVGTDKPENRPQGTLQVPLVRTPKQTPASTADQIQKIIIGSKWLTIPTSTELRPSPDFTTPGKVNPNYLTREFEYFENNQFKGVIIQYLDAARKSPILKAEFEGVIEWKGQDPFISGAQKVDYTINKAFKVTPLAQSAADMLNQNPIDGINKWEVNAMQSILGKSFPPFGLKAGEFMKDHDIIYIYDNALYMAAKHVDGTSFALPENRPQGVLQIPLFKN